MPQVCPRVPLANRARAFGIERACIFCKSCIANIKFPARGEHTAGAAVASWHYAIEHIHAAIDSLYQVLGCSDSHQISWRVNRHLRSGKLNYVIHNLLFFTDAKSTYRVSVE